MLVRTHVYVRGACVYACFMSLHGSVWTTQSLSPSQTLSYERIHTTWLRIRIHLCTHTYTLWKTNTCNYVCAYMLWKCALQTRHLVPSWPPLASDSEPEPEKTNNCNAIARSKGAVNHVPGTTWFGIRNWKCTDWRSACKGMLLNVCASWIHTYGRAFIVTYGRKKTHVAHMGNRQPWLCMFLHTKNARNPEHKRVFPNKSSKTHTKQQQHTHRGPHPNTCVSILAITLALAPLFPVSKKLASPITAPGPRSASTRPVSETTTTWLCMCMCLLVFLCVWGLVSAVVCWEYVHA